MNLFEHYLFSLSEKTVAILDNTISLKKYTTLDLSESNIALKNIEITNPDICQEYINNILKQNKALVAYGGYLEKRSIYADKINFSGDKDAIRNIHLGVDYWANAGTNVIAPLRGIVHSFNNNNSIGDYGPTIILQHTLKERMFYTLYGHLSLNSIENLYIGKEIDKGTVLGKLGTSDINVNYAPHLHFQIIKDIADYKGDYPGVCNKKDFVFYKQNCPDPNLLIKL